MTKPLLPRVKVGLIGVTGFGGVHYQMCLDAHRRGEIALDACVIINPEVVPEQIAELRSIGCEILSSADELFIKYCGKLDLVMVPTGIATHAPFTIRSLEMGASVFVEKPAAGTVAEVDSMHAAEAANPGFVAVGFQDVFRRDLQKLKRDLVEKKYGTVRKLSVLGCWPRHESYFSRNNWAGRIEVDGSRVNDSPANNAMAHFVNMGLFLAGRDFESSAIVSKTHSELRRANRIESFDTVTSRAELENGVELYLALTHACDDPENITKILIETDQCRLVLDFGGKETRVETFDGQLLEMLPSNYEWDRAGIMDDLLRRLRGEDQFLCSLKIAKSHTQLIERLHADSEIRDFNPSEVSSKEWNGSTLHYVPEMSQRLALAIERDVLLNETKEAL